jgi:hypothetical protein
MKREYIRLLLDFSDLSELNRLAASGWKAISVVPILRVPILTRPNHYWVLMEREIPAIGTPENSGAGMEDAGSVFSQSGRRVMEAEKQKPEK